MPPKITIKRGNKFPEAKEFITEINKGKPPGKRIDPRDVIVADTRRTRVRSPK